MKKILINISVEFLLSICFFILSSFCLRAILIALSFCFCNLRLRASLAILEGCNELIEAKVDLPCNEDFYINKNFYNLEVGSAH